MSLLSLKEIRTICNATSLEFADLFKVKIDEYERIERNSSLFRKIDLETAIRFLNFCQENGISVESINFFYKNRE